MSVRTRRSCAATTSSTCSSKGSTSLARPSWHPSCRRTRKLPHRARSHLTRLPPWPAPTQDGAHSAGSHLGLLPLTGGAEPSLALGQVCAVVPRVGRRAARDDRRARGRVYDRGEGPDRSALPGCRAFPLLRPFRWVSSFVHFRVRVCPSRGWFGWSYVMVGLVVCLFVCLFVCLVVRLWPVRASVAICTAVRLVSACW
jgi:hypothetical protein